MTKTNTIVLVILALFAVTTSLTAAATVEIDPSGKVSAKEDAKGHVYYEFTNVDHFNYYPEEFEGDGRPKHVCGDKGVDPYNCYHRGSLILSSFVVAGVNLAGYQMQHPKFQLFEDFNIGPMLKGDEGWKDLLNFRRQLKRPSWIWYVDKVARKRWLREQGYPQPKYFYLKYKSELSTTGKKEDEVAEILKNLPTDHGFCAK